MKKKIAFRSLIALTAIYFVGCSVDKNTALRRSYHNLTAHYNIFFNGNESFKAGVEKIKLLPENYTAILPIFPEETDAAATTSKSDMDNSIQKAVKLIKMHSITAKPARKKSKSGKKGEKLSKEQEEFYQKSEYCNWVDDSYLLIGKSHYYLHDYHTGMKSLQLILNKFKNEPIRFDAMYWIALSYCGLGEYSDAVNYLNLIKADENYPKKFDREIKLINANIYIKQKKYEKAISELDTVVAMTKKKKEKIRLQFILAQLHQKLNQNSQAMDLYSQIIRSNPLYEMAFNAKINMAKSFNAGDENSDDLKNVLRKMLKDDKNSDYQDQIYYALADISKKESDEKSAVAYYKMSITKSTTNTNQKALSYLALADIYFSKPDYINAGAYYDSTMTVLDKNYPDYEVVSQKAGNLSGLIQNLKSVAEQDSLQRVAKMSEAQRKTFIESLIAQVKQKELAEKNAGNNNNYDPFSVGEYGNDNTQKGNWYFYNPTAIGIGKSEFSKIWGTRKLEDHWRRKNKAAIIEANENPASGDSSGKITNNKDPNFYLQNLPLNDSLMQISDNKIINALYAVGDIYEKQMKDYPQAVKAYEELLRRYPKNSLELETYFNLYLIHHKNTGNTAQAEKYRNKILDEYPNSKYAKILSDPNYLKKLEETKNAIDKLYEEAYTAYKINDFESVLAKTDEAFSISPDNDLKPKFLFLKANVIGQKGDIEQMKEILKKIIADYPKDEITRRAQDELAVLESGKYDPDLYKYNENAILSYIIVIENDQETINKIKFKLSNFNVEKFPAMDLKVETKFLFDTKMLLTVKSLKTKTDGLNYMNSINSNFILADLKPGNYEHFLISEDNLNKLLKLPDVGRYLEFYKKNYQLQE